MKKIILVLSLGAYFAHTQENSSTIRVAAEVLNIERLKELKISMPANTQNGDHIYITAPREFHENGSQERIWDNKI